MQEELRPGGNGVREAFLNGENDPLTLRCPRLNFSSFPLPSFCSLESSQSILVKGPRESLGRNSLTFRHPATPRSKADRPRCSSLAKGCYWMWLDGLFMETPQPRRAGSWSRELPGRLSPGDGKGGTLTRGQGHRSPVVPCVAEGREGAGQG